MAYLSLSVWGELQVWQDDVPVQAFESDKVRALLAYLAVEADHAHQRETLNRLLWLDYSEAAILSNLRASPCRRNTLALMVTMTVLSDIK